MLISAPARISAQSVCLGNDQLFLKSQKESTHGHITNGRLLAIVVPIVLVLCDRELRDPPNLRCDHHPGSSASSRRVCLSELLPDYEIIALKEAGISRHHPRNPFSSGRGNMRYQSRICYR